MIALIFDTETTGFKSSSFTPDIVQIGALLQDTDTRRVLGELNVICKASHPIPTQASNVHGITDELCEKHGLNPALAERIFAELANRADVVVAHNLQFDVGIIKDVWPLAYRILMNKQQYCTMRNATEVIKLPGGKYHGEDFSAYKPPKLIEAYRHFFGTDFEGAHDAMADVRACRDVFFKLHELKSDAAPDIDPEIKLISCQTDGCVYTTKNLRDYETHVANVHMTASK